jgi:hypothetical protein
VSAVEYLRGGMGTEVIDENVFNDDSDRDGEVLCCPFEGDSMFSADPCCLEVVVDGSLPS